MESGKVPMQYSKILGYRKGPDGLPEIEPVGAETVRLIFKLYLKGYSLGQIQTELEDGDYAPATGIQSWSRATIRNILTNEKYIGDALLQKTFVTDCISKTVRKNNGERPMYYVENHHEAIIPKVVFQMVQEEMSRRASKRKVLQKSAKTEQGKYSGKYALTERLVCGECGSPYKRCTWNIRGKKKIVWRCVSRLEFGKKYCHNSPTLEEETLHTAILSAINDYADTQRAAETALECVEMVVGGTEETSLADLQLQIRQLTEEQESLLDRLLEDMDGPELAAQMQALTERKQALQQQIGQMEQDAEDQQAAQYRLEELRSWLETHPAGLREYDDLLTRQYVEKITAVDKEHIRVKFYRDDMEYGQSL